LLAVLGGCGQQITGSNPTITLTSNLTCTAETCVTFRDFPNITIDGGGFFIISSSSYACTVFNFASDIGNITIQNINFVDVSASFEFTTTNTNVTFVIESSTFTNSPLLVFAASTFHTLTFRNNTIVGTSFKTNWFFPEALATEIVGNSFIDCGGSGGFVDSTSAELTFSGNTISGGQFSAFMQVIPGTFSIDNNLVISSTFWRSTTGEK
jgi:hypothetical protein